MLRTVVRLREMLANDEELARKAAQHGQEMGVLFEQIQALAEPPAPVKKFRIGFSVTDDE